MPWDKVDQKYFGTCLCGAPARCCGGTYQKAHLHGSCAKCDRCGNVRATWAVGDECRNGICTVSGKDKIACPRRKIELVQGM